MTGTAGEPAASIREAACALLEQTAATLTAAGVPQVAIADFVPEHRRFGITRKAVMRPIGHGWPLGVLLVESNGTLRATGKVTRATPPGHRTHVATSIEERRAHRAAAFRGPFAEGATVYFDAPAIDLDRLDERGPLAIGDGGLLVRWSPRTAPTAVRPFAHYLAERTALLLHPPERA